MKDGYSCMSKEQYTLCICHVNPGQLAVATDSPLFITYGNLYLTVQKCWKVDH